MYFISQWTLCLPEKNQLPSAKAEGLGSKDPRRVRGFEGSSERPSQPLLEPLTP